MKWCEKCQSEYDDNQDLCMGCGGLLVIKETEEAVSHKNDFQQKKEGQINTPGKSDNKGGQTADMRNAVSRVSIAWPKVSLCGHDIEFETPAIAKASYTIEVVVSWIAALIIAGIGIFAIMTGEALIGLGICLSAAIGLVCALVLAKLAYEMIVLFFEQLRVTKQVRDLLLQKMRD